MNQDKIYKKLFANYGSRTDGSSRICEGVMTKIKNKRTRDARVGLVVHGICGLAALIVFVPATQYASTTANQSGFTAYISLAMSDGAYLTHMWKDFLLSLVQSAPIVEIVAVLAIVLVFAYSLKKITDDVITLRPQDGAHATV